MAPERDVLYDAARQIEPITAFPGAGLRRWLSGFFLSRGRAN